MKDLKINTFAMLALLGTTISCDKMEEKAFKRDNQTVSLLSTTEKREINITIKDKKGNIWTIKGVAEFYVNKHGNYVVHYDITITGPDGNRTIFTGIVFYTRGEETIEIEGNLFNEYGDIIDTTEEFHSFIFELTENIIDEKDKY